MSACKSHLYLMFFLALTLPCFCFATPVLERNLWVEAISTARTLDSRESIDLMLKDADELGVGALYVQVFKNGRAWFYSSFADSGWTDSVKPKLKDTQSSDFDPLGYLLTQSKIPVHAWINMFNLGQGDGSLILKRLGEQVLIVDSKQRGVRSYLKRNKNLPILDTPGLWLDPANQGVALYLKALISELLEKYRGLSGVHLDYIRYPYTIPIRPSSAVKFGIDFGYGKDTRQLFINSTESLQPFLFNSSIELATYNDALSWDSFRREVITNYVREVRMMLSSKQLLSVAAMSWSDRAYLSAFQDWRDWFSSGLVQQLCLMNYTRDNKHYMQMLKQAMAFKASNSTLLAGIGAWLLNPEQILLQEQLAAQAGADGSILFSYANLKKQPKLMAQISRKISR